MGPEHTVSSTLPAQDGWEQKATHPSPYGLSLPSVPRDTLGGRVTPPGQGRSQTYHTYRPAVAHFLSS